MRFSSLVIAATLALFVAFSAQQVLASGSPASSGGSTSASHGGGSTSSASSSSSSSAHSTASHSSSSISSSHSTSGTTHGSGPATGVKSSHSESVQQEKQGGRSFFHPFRKPKPVERAVFVRPQPCWRKPCTICPAGASRSGRGACVPVSQSCTVGQGWVASCGTPYWFNNCRALEQELAALRQQMQRQGYFGQSVEYRRLQQQYEYCLAHSRTNFAYYGFYAFNGAGLFDVP